MKKNKRHAVMFLAGVVALSGVLPAADTFSRGMTVQAADQTFSTSGGVAMMGTGTASIVVNGNSGQTMLGKRFQVYKLFDAENAKDNVSINYTLNTEYEQALKNVVSKAMSINSDSVTEYMVIDYIQGLNTNPVEGAQTTQMLEGSYSKFRKFVEDIRDEINRLGLSGDVVNVDSVRDDNSILLSGLDYGYYIIDEITEADGTHSASSLCMVDTANPEAGITLKSDYPSVTKKILEDDEKESIGSDGWNDIADYEIGQTVPYKYVSDVPNMNGYDTYYYAWHDVMDEALTFDKSSVKIEISDGTEKYNLTPDEFLVTENIDGETFKVEIVNIKEIVDREFNQIDSLGHHTYGQTVTLYYEAVLNDNAAEDTGRPGFENDVRLEFSNDPDTDNGGSTGYTPWDTVVCFTYKLNVIKTNNHNKVLEGAKFRLYSDSECENEVYVKKDAKGYVVINRDSIGGADHTGGTAPGEAVEMVSAEDGTFVIFGLDQGTYYLKETEAPDGYRALLDPIVLKVSPEFTSSRNSYVKGQGALDSVLQDLTAEATIETFYSGLEKAETKSLVTNVEEGDMNLSVVNQTGVKLPVTGTPALIIMFAAGVGMMTYAVVSQKKKK